MKTTTKKEDLPREETTEVCFSGRSNVGKSSLLNAIANCGKAKVSDRPGHTRSVDFYRIHKYLRLVDLPGYGFAFVNEERSKEWNEFVKDYIKTRKTLKRVYLLVDSRHGLKERDKEFLQFLEKNNITNQIVLTKTDMLYPDELGIITQQVTNDIKKMKHSVSPIILVSSKTRSGILEIQREITGLIDREQLSKLKDESDKNILAKVNDITKQPKNENKKLETTLRFKKSKKSKTLKKSETLKKK